MKFIILSISALDQIYANKPPNTANILMTVGFMYISLQNCNVVKFNWFWVLLI